MCASALFLRVRLLEPMKRYESCSDEDAGEYYSADILVLIHRGVKGLAQKVED